VHKITTEKALETGVDLLTILKVFSSSVKSCGLMVAHNYSYDYNIMGSELLRNDLENSLKDKEHICTMKASTEFCKIPGPYGYKWPKLEELYHKLFNEAFNAHNAFDDLKATARCFWKLDLLSGFYPHGQVFEIIEQAIEKYNINAKDFSIKDDLYEELHTYNRPGISWIEKYNQAQKLRFFDDESKFTVRYSNLDLYADVRFDERIPDLEPWVDFDDYWEYTRENNQEINPFYTSTILFKNTSGQIYKEQYYYEGYIICQKIFLNRRLKTYTECSQNGPILCNKEWNENSNLISFYKMIDIESKLSYYAYLGGRNKVSSIQFFIDGTINSIIRYNDSFEIIHKCDYITEKNHPSLNYIEDVRFYGSSKNTYIKDKYIFKKNELFIHYKEFTVDGEVIFYFTSCSDLYQCDYLEPSIFDKYGEILSEIHLQNSIIPSYNGLISRRFSDGVYSHIPLDILIAGNYKNHEYDNVNEYD